MMINDMLYTEGKIKTAITLPFNKVIQATTSTTTIIPVTHDCILSISMGVYVCVQCNNTNKYFV